VYYFESLVALMAAFTMPADANGKTFEQTLAEVRQRKTPVTNLFAHLFNHICIGHTHYPHSMPYLNLNGWIDSRPVQALIGKRFEQLNSELANFLFGYEIDLNIFKMRYHNSGTVGMHEGVIWALQIDESGQPRLVYWTNNTKPDQPFTMDWDIPPMPEATRTAYNAKFESALAYFSQLVAPELVHPDRPRTLETSGIGLESLAENVDFDLLRTSSISGSTGGGVLLDIFLKLLGNKIFGTSGVGQLSLGKIDAVWSGIKSLVSGLNLDGSQLNNLTGIWYLLTHTLPGNNLKFTGTNPDLSGLYLNLVLPFFGSMFQSNFSDNDDMLKLTIDFLKK